MRIESFIALILTLTIMSCGHEDAVEADVYTDQLNDVRLRDRAPTVDLNDFDLDIFHRTCALYVAVRSAALKDLSAFDREMDQDMVRWNMCDSGTMVACAKVPTVDGDTVRVGIPWLHGDAPQF